MTVRVLEGQGRLRSWKPTRLGQEQMESGVLAGRWLANEKVTFTGGDGSCPYAVLIKRRSARFFRDPCKPETVPVH